MKSKFIYTTMLAIMVACVTVISPGCSDDGEVVEVLQDTYTPENSGLIGSTVRCITIDAQGRKWIGTDKGISVFNGSTWTNYTTENGLGANNVYCIAIDAQGNKWIGHEKGYDVFDGNNWKHYRDEIARQFAIDAQNHIWMLDSYLSLNMFDGTGWTHKGGGNCFAIDAQGNIWTGRAGVIYDDGSGHPVSYNTSDGLIGSTATCIAIDQQGHPWVGTEGGISAFDGTNWTSYTTANSGLTENGISSMAIDAQGRKWIGTWGAGVCMFDGTNWTNPAIDGRTEGYTHCITIDARGNKWCGTWNGIGIIKAQ